MTLDQAIQDMLFNSTEADLEAIEWLARKDRKDILNRYQSAYGWSIAECEEFFDCASLAYNLLLKGEAA